MTREEYNAEVERDFKALDPKRRTLWKYPSRSAIIERIMRLGREVRAWDLKEADYEDVAVMTLKSDFVKSAHGLGIY